MHVLYFPLITDDVTTPRPDPGWSRQLVRDTSNGWRCVFLFRPAEPLDEFVLWERTRSIQDRLESCVSESADTAYLLAQRAVKVVRESGVDAGDTFRWALLVSDGHKLHFYLKGFRCLLWGVPVEGSPPLRLTQEDKQNVIESRDFPSLQRRDLPQSAPFIAEPVVAVVDQAQPDGLLASFTKTLESLLVLGGPVSLHRRQSAEAMRGDAAMWHLWEEMANLAAVDLRRLESKLNQFSDRFESPRQRDRGLGDLWRRAQPLAVPALLVLNLALLLLLIFRGAPATPSVPAAPPPAPSPASFAAPAVPGAQPTAAAAAPAAAPSDGRPAAAPAAPVHLPTLSLPGITDPTAAPTAAPSAPAAAEPAGGAPGGATASTEPASRIAAWLVDTTPTDRIHFTQPVKQFIDGRVATFVDSGGELTDKARRTMVDVAVQLYTNRRCAGERFPVRVDGEAGERTLQQVRRCAQEGYPGFDALLGAYGQQDDIPALEARVAAVVTARGGGQ